MTAIAVLPQVIHRVDPYPYFFGSDAVPRDVLHILTDLFSEDLPWDRHDSFYHGFFAEVADRVGMPLRQQVASRLRELTGLPLADDVTITAQRMEPGDHVPPHTDRPLLGFEAVRMVLQLDDASDAGAGGVFHVHADAAGGQISWSHASRRGDAIVFVLRTSSHHSVSVTQRSRRTLVFHARHLGNDAEVANYVQAVYSKMRFDQFPASLDPLIAEAETGDSFVDKTRGAACVAWALMQWGCEDEVIGTGYRSALADGKFDDDIGPVALARWLSFLWTEHFDVDIWAELADRPWRGANSAIENAWQVLFGRALR